MLPPVIEGMAKGLVIYFLQGKMIEQAIEEGREFGLPAEVLEGLPEMVFQATAAAAAVQLGERTKRQVLKVMMKRGALKEEAEYLVELALSVIDELTTVVRPDEPVPNLDRKWFEYSNI